MDEPGQDFNPSKAAFDQNAGYSEPMDMKPEDLNLLKMFLETPTPQAATLPDPAQTVEQMNDFGGQPSDHTTNQNLCYWDHDWNRHLPVPSHLHYTPCSPPGPDWVPNPHESFLGIPNSWSRIPQVTITEPPADDQSFNQSRKRKISWADKSENEEDFSNECSDPRQRKKHRKIKEEQKEDQPDSWAARNEYHRRRYAEKNGAAKRLKKVQELKDKEEAALEEAEECETMRAKALERALHYRMQRHELEGRD